MGFVVGVAVQTLDLQEDPLDAELALADANAAEVRPEK